MERMSRSLYDANADFVLEEIGKLAGQYGAARIVIEGHADSSMKGSVPAALVKEFSSNRANAVKEALIKKFTILDPKQFSAMGMGGVETRRPLGQGPQPGQEPPCRGQGFSVGVGAIR